MPNIFVSASNGAFPAPAEILLLYPCYPAAARCCQPWSCSLFPKPVLCTPQPLLEGGWRPDMFGQPVTGWQAIDWASQHQTKSKAVSLPWQVNPSSLTSATGNKALRANSRWNPGKDPEKLLSISDATFWTCWWFVTPHPLALAPNQ